jgi:hypothetical protein
MAKLDQEALSQIVGAVLASLQAQGAASPKPAPQFTNSFGKLDLAANDRSLIAGFKRKGYKEAEMVLMDRADKSKPFNIKPYKAWIAEGRVVRRGEKGVRGLFHITQTDPVPAKPEMSAERKGLFKKAAAKAKGKLTPVA